VEERLAAFGLKVASEKTATRRFDGNLIKGPGRPAVKPDSFTFLGFTHFITKTRNKKVNIVRTPSVQSRVRFLRRVAEWLRAHRHIGPRPQQEHLTKMLQGPVPILRIVGLRSQAQRRPVSDVLAVATDPATPERYGTADDRLGHPQREILALAPSTATDTGVGLTSFSLTKRMCSGEPVARKPHGGF
jgi:hypothetical protein